MIRSVRLGLTALCLIGLTRDATAQTTNTASLEVIGGPRAGQHTLAAEDIGCMISEADKARGKPKYFDTNFGLSQENPRSKDPKALTMVKVTIRNAALAGPIPPDQFDAQILFGPFGDRERETFYLSGLDGMGRKGGPGTVTFVDEGKSARVTLDLQPKPGVSVKGTVTCTRVSRVGGR